MSKDVLEEFKSELKMRLQGILSIYLGQCLTPTIVQEIQGLFTEEKHEKEKSTAV